MVQPLVNIFHFLSSRPMLIIVISIPPTNLIMKYSRPSIVLKVIMMMIDIVFCQGYSHSGKKTAHLNKNLIALYIAGTSR